MRPKKSATLFGSNGFFVSLRCVEIRRDRVEVMTVYRPKVAYQRPYFISFSSMSSMK